MSQALDKHLHSAIDMLSDKQKKAVLTIVTAITGEERYGNHWQDESFVSEMESRYNYYKNGGKMITPEEADKRIKELLEKAKSK